MRKVGAVLLAALSLMASTVVVRAAGAAVGTPLRSFTPTPSGNGRALAFDPHTDRLYYTLFRDPNIYIVDTQGHALGSIQTGHYYSGLAWDSRTKRLWASRLHSPGASDLDTVDPRTGDVTHQFTFTYPTQDSCYGQPAGVTDGLALDHHTLWLSDDAARTVYHVDDHGRLIGHFTVP